MSVTRWQSEILDLVRGEGAASIADLAARLGVSGETVRRHIRALVAEGLLLRSHGGVRAADGAREPPFLRRMRERAAQKRAIGRAAAALVPDGATVMIDTGSTTAYVAAALAGRRGLTVITNSVEIARPLIGRGGHRVYLAGGEIRPDLFATAGAEALGFIAQFRADLAILSVGAIDADYGFTDYHLDEARVAQAMIARSESAMVVADGAKFGAPATVLVCPLAGAARLVTDAPPAEAFAAPLAAAGVAVTVAAA